MRGHDPVVSTHHLQHAIQLPAVHLTAHHEIEAVQRELPPVEATRPGVGQALLQLRHTPVEIATIGVNADAFDAHVACLLATQI